jgi:hypothetical protein
MTLIVTSILIAEMALATLLFDGIGIPIGFAALATITFIRVKPNKKEKQ